MKPKRNSKTDSLPLDVSECDREFVIDTFHALSAEEKKRWKRVQAKLSSSKNGKDESVVIIHVEKELLAQVDSLADKLGTSRETLITRGIKAVLIANNAI
jgi:hypothetical protein